MSEESTANIEGFLNKHLVKVFYGVIIYFLTTLSSDFKDVKVTLQQLLVNQATIEARLTNIENVNTAQDKRMDGYEESRTEFYKTYKLTKKGD